MSENEPRTEHFNLDMTIAEAMEVDPKVREVFAAFHLGGCAHCAMGKIETLRQVCEGYGVDGNQLLEVLEGVLKEDEQKAEA